MPAAGYVVLADRGVLALHGGDARSFLQGLISSDVTQIEADRAGYGALLTPQGKYLFDFFIAQEAGRLLLETEAARIQQLLQRLLMYRLRSKVDLTDVGPQFAVVAVIGDQVAQLLEVDDVLVDSMRGRSSTWTRIRVNLRHVPEDLRPPQETPDPDDDPTREWRGRRS